MKKYIYTHATVLIYSLYTLIMVALLWGFHLKEGTPNYVLATIITIVLCGYWFIFYYRILKKNRIQVLLFIVAVTTGVYGFKFQAIEEYSLTNALYSTFRLFLLDVDPVFSKSASKFTTYPLAIEISRWTAAAYTISTLFSLIYLFFNQSLKLALYRIFGNHIVISGYHKKSKVLIENLRKQQKKVVLIVEEISESQMTYLRELGVILLIGKQGSTSLYKKCKLSSAEYFIIFHEEDSKNLNEILSLNVFVKETGVSLSLKQVIVHLGYHQSYELFEEIETDLSLKTNRADYLPVKPFNLQKLVAEKLFNEYPLHEGYEERLRSPNGEALHLLIIGFGQTGQHLAVQAIERAHYINSAQIKITILDKHAEKVKKDWYDNYPKSKRVADLTFHTIDIETDSIDDYVLAKEAGYTHIFVCLKDDFEDLKAGIQLGKTIPHLPIYLKLSEKAQISHWLHTNTEKFNKLYLFGNYEEALTYDYVVNDQLENRAKNIHEAYKTSKEVGSKKKQGTWDQLSTFLKESNRNQLNHAEVKLMLMGLKAVAADEIAKSGQKALTAKEYLAVAQEQLALLGAAEHQRWNAFHFLRGWDTLEEIADGKTKDPDKRLHACLVTYDDLKKIEEITGEDYQKYDCDVVLELYQTMQMGRYGIVKE
ncbi:NAD-binding protein [Neobacillus niacini]|uniref:NAD-binding protein n=1 Tax=Neobacillus niacini TaxID=86668 RepID=UPI0007ABC337|nr:NAD-binding protein [Neobacillus niacini]MEC1525682.1 NAD-binding protein [Neobacillus niacini]